MNILDLAKATVVCGGLSFLSYNYAVLSQILLIGFLGLLWLLYLRQTFQGMRRR